MSNILDKAREELAKGNGADSCPLCYSMIRSLVADGERLERELAEAREHSAFMERMELERTNERDEALTAVAALRQRHAEAVKKTWAEAFSEGWDALDGTPMTYTAMRDAAWLASESKKGLT